MKGIGTDGYDYPQRYCRSGADAELIGHNIGNRDVYPNK